jgi:hypothetical protein
MKPVQKDLKSSKWIGALMTTIMFAREFWKVDSVESEFLKTNHVESKFWEAKQVESEFCKYENWQ